MQAGEDAVAQAGELAKFNFEKFSYQGLHDSKITESCYKVVDEPESESGKALSISLRKELVRNDAFSVLSTPALDNLETGAYRVTVRMKMQGMPNSLGSSIAVRSGRSGREIFLNEFRDRGVFEEFAFDGEVWVGRDSPSLAVSLSFPRNTTGLGVACTRGASTPFPTLQSLVIDWIKIEKLPDPDHLVVRSVLPRYPWRSPGEKQVFHIQFHNRTGRDQSARLRLTLHNGLLEEQAIGEREVFAKNGEVQDLEWEWPIPPDQRLWGQEAVVGVVSGSGLVGEARCWFTVHPFNNAVMFPHPNNRERFQHPYASSQELQNHAQYFGAGGTIYDSAGVVPDPEIFDKPYIAGNGRAWASVPFFEGVAKGDRAQGIAPFFYLESSGSAMRAFEIYWDHPDWVPQPPANTDEFLTKRQQTYEEGLKLWDGAWNWKTKDGKTPPSMRAGGAYSGQLVALNGLVKENVDRVIEGVLKYCERVPWQGIRWDGLPFRASNTKALGGDYGKTEEELKQISAANVVRFRKEVRARFPHFELRANHSTEELMEWQQDPFHFERAYALMDQDVHGKELLRDHGSIMEEAWMGYAGFGDYKNVCKNYLRAAHFESSAIKHAGGHHGHMLWFYDGNSQYTPDEIYQQLFSFLGGAHLDAGFGPIPDSVYDLGVYAARFCEFFWDPVLRPIPALHEKINVDVKSDLWYAEGGFQKVNEKNNLLYILPIINPPVTERWLTNRFGLLPEPIREPFTVWVKVPPEFPRVVRVCLLDNNPYPRVRPLEHRVAEGEVSFQIPELVVFKVAAIEFGK
ncbi:MAG: hypothetical protein HYU36_11445 [Planctomycetes bacterium]|nr:hypothetical protein [Planctomycetota bacterium]